MASFTQNGRLLQVTTTLAFDVLLLDRFEGVEGVSRPFRFQLEMLSEDAAIDAEKLLREEASVTLELPDGGKREFHGLISRFGQYGERDVLTVYRMEIVPWIWFLSLSTDSRIFQNLNALEIVERVFKKDADEGKIPGRAKADFTIKTVGAPPPKREFCVQYRETNLDFVSRLLEEEGYFYFFEHTAQGHKLIIANHGSAVAECPDAEKVRMAPAGGALTEDNVVLTLEREHQVASGAVVLRDYDYLKSTTRLSAEESNQNAGELYDYPGGFMDRSDGKRYARLRLEEREATQHVVQGGSTIGALRSGYRFLLRDDNQTYQLLRVKHTGHNGGYVAATQESAVYNNDFVAIPQSVPYRPPRSTPRPVVHGSQTAVVVGPPGEEIHTDVHGRVKIQFHWDREGKRDANSSCWVRVSSAWAGKNWGFVAIPRIGQEVVVDFLEGNPDRPIIVGRIYNDEQTVPYALPDNGTQTGLKSRSSKGGAAANFNELRFEDKKGSEEITLHAERNLSVTVEADKTESVGHDDTQTVTNDRTITVKGTHTEDITKNTKITILKGDLETHVKAGESFQTVKKDNTIEVDGAMRSRVVKDIVVLSTEGNLLVAASKGKITEESKAGHSVQSDGAILIQSSAGDVTIKSPMKISLEVGPSKIEITPAGIKISSPAPVIIGGTPVKIN